jgi:hypothetical protein
MLSRSLLPTIIIAAAAVLASGCNMQKLTANQTADLLLMGSISLERESDMQFAREALPGGLKTMETFLVASPDNESLHLLLTRGYTTYAFAFLEGEAEKGQFKLSQDELDELNRRAVLHYMRARDYGFMLLDKPEFEDAAKSGRFDDAKARLKQMEEEDVEGLFWVAQAWGSAINLRQEDPDMLDGLELVEAIMDRMLELDDDYYFAGPHLLKAVYLTSKPPMFGGDPEKAKEHFEIAMARHGDQLLLIPYLYGRFYGAQKQDVKTFNRMMKHVLEADLESYPDQMLANEIARDRARFWVANSSELFFE